MVAYGNMMDFGGMMGYGGWWFAFAVVFWLLLLVALILTIFWLIKNVTGSKGQTSAVEILKQRYARGEITKKEYEDQMKDLER